MLTSDSCWWFIGQPISMIKQGKKYIFPCNALWPRQYWGHFTDDILKFKFWYAPCYIFPWKLFRVCRFNDTPALIQLLAWHRIYAMPLTEQMSTIHNVHTETVKHYTYAYIIDIPSNISYKPQQIPKLKVCFVSSCSCIRTINWN